MDIIKMALGPKLKELGAHSEANGIKGGAISYLIKDGEIYIDRWNNLKERNGTIQIHEKISTPIKLIDFLINNL